MQNPENNDGTKQEAMLASELLDENNKTKKFWRGLDQNCTRPSECSPTSSAALQFAKTVEVLPTHGDMEPQGGGP